MPQLNQLGDVFGSQLLWLLLTLAVMYFGIGRAMLPKIQSTVDARNSRIAEDLAAAERAKAAAEETEHAYRARMEQSRVEALKVTQAAKD
jgi:F-type H+-transporting ATPase subunit b